MDVFRICAIEPPQSLNQNLTPVSSLDKALFTKGSNVIIRYLGKVFISGHVVFDENMFPYHDPQSLFHTSQGDSL